jgi:hypothetical protein
MIFALTKILRLKKLRQADDASPASRSLSHAVERLQKILFRLRPARHLHQSHTKCFRGQLSISGDQYSIHGEAVTFSYQLSTLTNL